MKKTIFVYFFLFSILSFGQAKVNYALIDKKMDAIPSSLTQSTDSIAKYINSYFKTENEKIRAVFYWTASNISYDLENMYVVNYNETPQERIAKTLKTQKGICMDYANVFHEIANAVGIKSILVQGYTKKNERVSNLSHMWCAAKIDNKWYLFDPTWGSGYVNSNDNKYTRNTTNSYYKVAPENMIYSHMPFDYLWQFMNYPVTNQEFIQGVIAGNESKEKFDFISEIAKYESLSKVNQFAESSQRIEKNGMKNQLIAQAYINAKNKWNYEKGKEKYEKDKEIFEKRKLTNSKISEIVSQSNLAKKGLNEFINYRNIQFQPFLPDEEIKNMIQKPRDALAKCKMAIHDISNGEDQNTVNLEKIENNISQSLAKAEEHLQFVNLYLSKPKLARKTMFYTIVRTSKKIN